MILADKIVDLRKKNGWSQEELAGRLEVSRQAVSKWESAASIPDLDKIIKLSELFGVSTDYLLKDVIQPDIPEITETISTEASVRVVTLEEANGYLDVMHNAAGKIALGVSMCIFSPIILIFLGGLADEEGGRVLPEATAVGIGIVILLLLVTMAVSLFILFGRKLEAYAYLEKEAIELSYGVAGIVEKRKSRYEDPHGRALAVGVGLCILSVIPIMVGVAIDEAGMTPIIGVDICLFLIACGVFILVRTNMIYGAFQRLLEEEDYTREKKADKKRNEALGTIYWCTVTAIYLGWSFAKMNWERSWIIWPCAGVLFGAVYAVAALIKKK